jgi:FKBP-type peptidyl-prolyl cis-trans isomerase FklB
MKLFAALLIAISQGTFNALAQDKPDLTIPNQRFNYALGLDIVSTFKQMDVNIDLKAFAAGMQDALTGKALLSTNEQQAAMDALSKTMQAKAQELQKIEGARNLKEGLAFLAENKNKEGVRIKEVKARDGSKVELQYKILKSGAPGPSPKKTDTAEVHYVGKLIDGTEFDNSIKRGFPATFGVTDVLPGWSEALQMMKAGDEWELYLPPSLAYGEFPTARIGPNSTLIFDVQLLSFFTPKPQSPTENSPASK